MAKSCQAVIRADIQPALEHVPWLGGIVGAFWTSNRQRSAAVPSRLDSHRVMLPALQFGLLTHGNLAHQSSSTSRFT